ncbi:MULTISPECIES: HAD domain-containing protein [Paraburkholderia]|uniref:HAD domain-containing protein n=1 Tax=Paraburkholderia TaxID=1822464 RepID=UPI0022504FBC|nr:MULTISPECIES: HAD domain-containing protein [Paraburkholderia]MCX4164843.1 HAD domain-containing protein [Paraburkholderia megapolitana]MDN7160336.1 HAD domain-containing protein [Paraburkholderia sp. CHISQ3]MDQ6497383.1 HAD domain-containing protein [Paraburkholderia megapolitana]
MKTIFLDIDGVLHPSTVGELEYGPQGPRVTGPGVCALEAKLAPIVSGKAVDIAIHSTWIYMFDAKTLRTEYLPQLGQAVRIQLTDRRIESRALRILDYIRRRHLSPDEYLILDDAPKEFATATTLLPRLVACDPARGLNDPEVIDRIEEFLR